MEYKMAVIGASLGGLKALKIILAGLGESFPLPIVIVQHRGKGSGENLVILLQKSCALKVSEVEDKETIVPGRIYLAPADYHLLVEKDIFALSIDAPVNNARPSIDLLFESAAHVYGKQLIGLILTGTLRDGARGLKQIKKQGGYAIVQDPDTAEACDMPNAAIEATEIDEILPVDKIAPCLIKLGTTKNKRQHETGN